jgi:hypothetical protein
MDEKQIDEMVNRFLGWKLPENFNPDCGISYQKIGKPIGTNLFTATQAREMIKHILGVS